MLHQITPLILTYNEAPNIGRTMDQLDWAQKVIVVDSYSQDSTLEVLQAYPNVELYQRPFDNHTDQWNYGLAQVSTTWVLSLDADYILPQALLKEIESLSGQELLDGYFIPFKYCVFGKPLRGNILPPRLALFKRSHGRYFQDGHTQMLRLEGQAGRLKQAIYHDDRKPLSRWLAAQDKYMKLEVKKLMHTPHAELSLGDKVRKTKILGPFVVVFYCLILKMGILDGWRGWFYAFQRMLAETWLSIRLIEAQYGLKDAQDE